MTEHLKMVRENAYYKVCIINLIEAIQDVKELMGHSKIDTTLIYYNNTSKKIKSEYDNLI